METVVIAKFKNRRDANFVAGLIKRFRKGTTVIKGNTLEDIYLGELIEEGMQETGEISEKEFSSFLSKKIKAAK